MPVLSDRRNIVVIAKEAHRSQCDSIEGFAYHLRGALPLKLISGVLWSAVLVSCSGSITPRRALAAGPGGPIAVFDLAQLMGRTGHDQAARRRFTAGMVP
jgi:hypothetical protein